MSKYKVIGPALYRGYDITVVRAKRAINADAAKRGAIEEVLIRNYGTQ